MTSFGIQSYDWQKLGDIKEETNCICKKIFILPTCIFIDNNGITIKAKTGVPIGYKQEIRGKTYIVVDDVMLRNMISNNEDVSCAVTTFVKDMSRLLRNKRYFNQSIESWDTSNVVSMREMFRQAFSFNKDISNWNTCKVKNMNNMFHQAKAFNQDLSKWNVINVYIQYRNNVLGPVRFSTSTLSHHNKPEGGILRSKNKPPGLDSQSKWTS